MWRILTEFFGCSCANSLSFPITREGKTYCVCTQCGSEYVYDWQNMKVGEEVAA